MTLHIFPAHMFNPKRIRARIVESVLSGGTSLSGETDVIATDGGGRWEITYEGIDLRRPVTRKAWEAWEGYLGRGKTDCLVPLISLSDANRPTVNGRALPVPAFTVDDQVWPTSAGYVSVYIAAKTLAPASLRATSISIEVVAGSDLLGGEKFSYNGSAYRVIRPLGSDLYQIEPPLRDEIPFGADLDFEWPTVICRSVPGESWSVGFEFGRIGEASITFLENPSVLDTLGNLTIAVSANITNHYALTGDGMLTDKGYNNATGLPVAIQAFLTSGLMPITSAMRSNGFAISVDASRRNWVYNQARVNFYSDDNASGNFISSVTSGVALSADQRTITVAAASIPSSATHFGTNLKWTQGIPSLIYTSSNVIPDGAEDELESLTMVNSGVAAACLSAPDLAGTRESITAAPSLATRQFIVCQQGYTSLIRKPWQAGKHIVQKVDFSPESHDYNNTYQFRSLVQIDSTEPAPDTPGAFLGNFSASGADADTLAVQSDCHPAYNINGMYMGGAHGIVSSLITATGHGKTNADRGSIWSVGGTDYMLTQVYDANRLFLTALNTGTDTEWAISPTILTTGTATHVSGATNTGDITIASGVLGYLYPATRQISQVVTAQGGAKLVDNGVYTVTERVQSVSYQIPNAAATLDFIAANIGSNDDLDYNSASIDMQLQIDLAWRDDAYASCAQHQVTALQDHYCNFSWPTQWQPINARSSASETLHFIVPGTISCESGLAHSGGTPLDFSDWVDITANALEYYHDTPVWEDASWWADSVQRAPLMQAYGVKDSGGNWLRKFVMARSRFLGWTADHEPSLAHFLSGANKAYGVTRYNETVSEGDIRLVVAGYGWMDPAFDPSADINFTFPLGGGQHEWVYYASGVVSYTIPKRADLSSKNVSIGPRSAGLAVTVNADKSVTVSGSGLFHALVY